MHALLGVLPTEDLWSIERYLKRHAVQSVERFKNGPDTHLSLVGAVERYVSSFVSMRLAQELHFWVSAPEVAVSKTENTF